MMYSDYFALSSCAISVTFIPFMIVCQLRYGLILQAFNYRNRAYFHWLRCAFLAAAAPLLAVSAVSLLSEAVFLAYLIHTAATEMQIIVGYAVLMLIACAALAAGFGRFCKVLGGAGWGVPRVDDVRLRILFLCSALLTALIMLILNLAGWQQVIYFVPAATPFLVPLVNLFFPPRPGPVMAADTEAFLQQEEIQYGPAAVSEEIPPAEETKRWG